MTSGTRRAQLHWVKRHRKALIIGTIALILAAIAAYLIFDAARTPVVGDDRSSDRPSSDTPGSELTDDLGLNAGQTGGRTGPAIFSGQGIHEVTVTITSDVPFTAGGYLVIDGRRVEFPPGRTGTATFTVEGKSPLMVSAAQAGPASQNIECHTTVDGRRVDSFSATGPYGFVVCFA